MPSLPSSPVKPSTLSRYQSADSDYNEPASPGYTANGFPRSPPSPRSPRSTAPPSPVTPRHRNAQGMGGPDRISGDFSGAAENGGGGMGSLADELADAWDEDGGYDYASGQENPGESQVDQSGRAYHMRTRSQVSNSSIERPRPHRHKHKVRNGGAFRHGQHESQYDGSDYGNDSDLEESDISPGLEGQMADIESLARRGMENNGSESDHVIKRTVETLRDLGGQSGIENNAMRLITAHTSIASHLTHQTRTLQTLTHPLLFSPFPLLSLSTEAIDALIPLIDEGLLPNLPYPSLGQSQTQSARPPTPSSASTTLNPLISLQTLVAQTYDLSRSLRGLGDTLYESRQLTSTASRRLRSARDLVADLRREEEGREEGTRWIERGDWDRRLRDREAGRLCGDVVRGFEDVCGEWRERLFGGAVAGEVAAA